MENAVYYERSPFCRVAALDSLPTPVWKFPPNDGAFPDAIKSKNKIY